MGKKKKILEEKSPKVPNLLKDINLQVQEAQHTPNEINTMKTTHEYITIIF